MQKFRFGDLVKVDKNLGQGMMHFTCDCEAIVMYADPTYSRQSEPKYCIHIKGLGRVSWYNESQLTLIAEKQEHLINKWPKRLKQVTGNDFLQTVKTKFEHERNEHFKNTFRNMLKQLRGENDEE